MRNVFGDSDEEEEEEEAAGFAIQNDIDHDSNVSFFLFVFYSLPLSPQN